MSQHTGKIGLGSDHAGYLLKELIKEKLVEKGFEVRDFGAFSEDSADYPDHIHPLCRVIESGELGRGIIMCGSGNGVSITANKYAGIRAALSWNPEIARLARAHNDANVLALPARFIDTKDALQAVDAFLDTPFEGGRHTGRVKKIPTGQ
ncbi:MAG: ribose 5-phosphate isomerase B [Bacteroidia bacterium]|nr:MAG: ribose 5-phosphate isomerase B [Bacteroidia bacterium]